MLRLVLLLAACDGEPAAPAVLEPPRVSAEEIARKRQLSEIKSKPSTAAALGYTKPAGVYIDARYLGSQAFSVARGEIEQQLGPVIDATDLPEGQGQSMSFERAKLRVYKDRIYMIEVPLPEPLRRDQALATLGFPVLTTASWTPFSGEYRLLNVWGFRRLIFERKALNSEDIVRVQAWRPLEVG